MKINIMLKGIIIVMFVAAGMFYAPMTLGGDPAIQRPGTIILLFGGIYCFYELGVIRRKGMLIAIATVIGILIF